MTRKLFATATAIPLTGAALPGAAGSCPVARCLNDPRELL